TYSPPLKFNRRHRSRHSERSAPVFLSICPTSCDKWLAHAVEEPLFNARNLAIPIGTRYRTSRPPALSPSPPFSPNAHQTHAASSPAACWQTVPDPATEIAYRARSKLPAAERPVQSPQSPSIVPPPNLSRTPQFLADLDYSIERPPSNPAAMNESRSRTAISSKSAADQG